jgi:hypothetical protein
MNFSNIFLLFNFKLNSFVNIWKAQRLNPALLFDYQQILQLRKQGIGSQDTIRKDLGLLEKLR